MDHRALQARAADVNYGLQSAAMAKPDEQPSDISGHLQALGKLCGRAMTVQNQLSGLIARLYGEGDPPSPINGNDPAPRQVGMHHEISIAIATLESLMSNVEDKVDRLSKYA